MQDLLIEEGVAAVDALSRAAVLELQDEKHQFNANGKILPCLLVSMTPCSMSSIDILTPLTSFDSFEVLQALRALNLGPLAVPVAAPLWLGSEKRQDNGMHGAWRCMEHGMWMHFGFGF